MGQYRYRTSALTGPWRAEFDEAVKDAARAGQIHIDAEQGRDFRWIVPGKIEEQGESERQVRRSA